MWALSKQKKYSQIKKLNSRFLPPIILFFAVFLLYFQAISFDFSYDDLYQINDNELVTSKKSFLNKTIEIFSSPTFPGEQYRPLVTFSYYCQYIISGLNPSLFHLFNIFFHFLTSLLVFNLINFCLKNLKLSFFVALIFAVHPLQVESVASIVGRTEILACFFSLFSIIFYLKNNNKILCLIFFVLASLCKESAFTLIGIIPLLSYFFGEKQQNAKKEFITALYLFLLAVGLLIIRFLILKESFLIDPPNELYFSENPLFNMSLKDRIFPVSQVFGKYIYLFFFPILLKIDYSMSLAAYWNSLFSYNGFLYAFISILFFALLILKRKDKLSVFLVFFIFAFGVTINLVTPIGILIAERLIYFPIIGIASFFVFFLYKTLDNKIANIIFSLFFVFFSIRTLIRIPVWKNNASVFKSVQEDNPTSPRANLSYGMYLHNIEKNSELASKYFKLGYKLDPALTENARYLSDIAIQNKNLAKAEFWLSEVLRFEPQDERIQDKLNKVKDIRNRYYLKN